MFQHDLSTFATTTTKGRAVVIDDPVKAYSNVFHHLVPVGGVLVKNVDLTTVLYRNVINVYSSDVGIMPFPEAQTAGGSPVNPEQVLIWDTTLGDHHGWSQITLAGHKSYNVGQGRVDSGTPTVVTGQTTASPTTTTTRFKSVFQVGDRIEVEFTASPRVVEIRTVVSIASDTSLTVDSPFTLNTGGTFKPIAVYPLLERLNDSSGNVQFIISDVGNVGIGTATPTDKLTVNGFTNATAGLKLKHYSIAGALNSTNWPLSSNNEIATCWSATDMAFYLLVQEAGNKWKLQMSGV